MQAVDLAQYGTVGSTCVHGVHTSIRTIIGRGVEKERLRARIIQHTALVTCIEGPVIEF
jgi:hypothetical protein